MPESKKDTPAEGGVQNRFSPPDPANAVRLSGRPPLTDSDGEAREIEEADIAQARRIGRPPLPDGERKERVSIRLDRDVIAALKSAEGRGWTGRVNRILRDALKI